MPILKGRDTIAQAQSGTGKTACIVHRMVNDAAAAPEDRLLFATRSAKLRQEVQRKFNEELASLEHAPARPALAFLTADATSRDAKASLLPALEARLAPLGGGGRPRWETRTARRRQRYYAPEDGDDEPVERALLGEAAARERHEPENERRRQELAGRRSILIRNPEICES